MQSSNYQNFSSEQAALDFMSVRHHQGVFLEVYPMGAPWKYRVYYWSKDAPRPKRVDEGDDDE